MLVWVKFVVDFCVLGIWVEFFLVSLCVGYGVDGCYGSDCCYEGKMFVWYLKFFFYGLFGLVESVVLF